jgi:nicotinamidase-related amidase
MELLLQNSIGSGRLEIARTALLAIHWQIDAAKPEGAFGPVFAPAVAESGVIANTSAVIAACRARKIPIIYINVSFWPNHEGLIRNNGLFNTVYRQNGFVKGTAGVEVIPELAPQPGDFTFEHSRISAFHGTDLEILLKGLNIETLVFTGIATNVAVDHSVRDAAQLGFSTVLLEDCCCSSTPAYHDAALMTLRVLSTRVMDSASFIDAVRSA